jgi:hypothetical protein
MRVPNYKVGWIIPAKVAALTHFHSDITEADRMGVFTETQKLLEHVGEPFHIIIDNRHAPLEKLYTLQELQQFSPFLKHPQLRSLVIIKPMHLELDESSADSERSGEVVLKNVSSPEEALDVVSKFIEGVNKKNAQLFFG